MINWAIVCVRVFVCGFVVNTSIVKSDKCHHSCGAQTTSGVASLIEVVSICFAVMRKLSVLVAPKCGDIGGHLSYFWVNYSN